MVDTSDWCIGDLVLLPPESLVGKIMSFSFNSWWGGIGIYTGEGQFVSFVPLKGVVIRSIDSLPRYAVLQLPVSSECRSKIAHSSLCCCGQGSGFISYLRYAINVLFFPLSPSSDLFRRDFKGYEVVSKSLSSAGIFLSTDPDFLLPYRIFDYNFIRVVRFFKP